MSFLPTRRFILRAAAVVSANGIIDAAMGQSTSGDPLPSWNDGIAKSSILSFVARVTAPTGPDFVPPAERIATFDNDGTLWADQPIYFQVAFAIDRVKALAPQHPEWKEMQPFKAAIEDDVATLATIGEKGML